jgi:hypothetical protein
MFEYIAAPAEAAAIFDASYKIEQTSADALIKELHLSDQCRDRSRGDIAEAATYTHCVVLINSSRGNEDGRCVEDAKAGGEEEADKSDLYAWAGLDDMMLP